MTSFRVLTAEWSHETNTFSKIPTDIDSFHAQYYLKGPHEIEKERKGTKTTLGATFEAAEKYKWQLSTTIVASANPAGKVKKDTFEAMAFEILEPLHQGQVFEGVLLHLHGAMVTEEFEDAEGELLRRVRHIVGPDVPIMVTLDLHGNITPAMAEHANLLLAVRTYPHIDFYETAQRTAELLQLAMTKKIKPRSVIAKRPMLRGLDGGKTHPESNMSEIIRRATQYEDQQACLVVSICAGFMAADIYDIGPSVTVTVDVQQEDALQRGSAIAEALMDYAWESREYTSEHHYTIADAVAKASEYAARGDADRLVMADVADNPGSGHYGDTTDLLRALVEANLTHTVFYAIYDAQAALQAEKIGVGRKGSITLGGRGDASLGGGPLELHVEVVTLTNGIFHTYGPMGFGGMLNNFGLSAVLRVGESFDIVVISHNGQLLDNAQITSMGIDLEHKKVICVKSKHHFRACLSPLAKEIITVDGGGLGSALLVRKGSK
eukprot:gene36504-44285_t